MDVTELLKQTVACSASDLFLVTGHAPAARIGSTLQNLNDTRLMPEDTNALISQIYKLAGDRPMTQLLATGDDDFSVSIVGLSRFRINAYRQRNSFSAVIRVITFSLPEPSALHIPDVIMEFSRFSHGMVLVTGPAGSGKSTTLACLIDTINSTREGHIITLENPIEFLHPHKKSIVSQREVPNDTESYLTALRAALRQCPDVILLGEMRDFETISVAMTAAETGHLLFSTLHTVGAANTINRIIDVFPPNQQQQIVVQLSMLLNAVVSQQLVPTMDGSLVPVFEIMTVTPAIRNMIRERKIPQIAAQVYSGATPDMIAMDTNLAALCRQGVITKQTALDYCTNQEMMARKI